MICKSTIVKILLSAVSVLCLVWTAIMLFVLFRGNAGTAENEDISPENSHTLTEMTIPTRRIDVGEIRQGEVLNVDYLLINSGKDSLFIDRINPDCTCTDYRISSMLAAPGDSITLSLVVNTENRFGENVIRVVIESNTPWQQDLVKLHYNVLDEYQRLDSLKADAWLDLGKIVQSSVYEHRAKVMNCSSIPVILSVYTSCRCMEVHPYEMTVPANGSCEYVIRLTPEFIGEFDEYLVLRKTDSKSMMRIPVKAMVIGKD